MLLGNNNNWRCYRPQRNTVSLLSVSEWNRQLKLLESTCSPHKYHCFLMHLLLLVEKYEWPTYGTRHLISTPFQLFPNNSHFDFSTTHGLDFLRVVPHQKLKLNEKYPKCASFSLNYIFTTTGHPPYGNISVFTGRVCPLVVVTFITIKRGGTQNSLCIV